LPHILPNPVRTIKNINFMCEEYLKGRYKEIKATDQ